MSLKQKLKAQCKGRGRSPNHYKCIKILRNKYNTVVNGFQNVSLTY